MEGTDEDTDGAWDLCVSEPGVCFLYIFDFTLLIFHYKQTMLREPKRLGHPPTTIGLETLMSSHMFCTRSHLFLRFSAFVLNLSHVTITNTASLVLCGLVYSHYTHQWSRTSSYTVYLAQPHSLQSFNYRSGSSVDICTCTSQATHQQSHRGHVVTLAPYEAPHSQVS